MPKTPTQPPTFLDAWNGFKESYTEFVKWQQSTDDEFEFCQIRLIDESPIEYKNKWNRIQWKMLVEQDGEERMLSGGSRLFVALKKCLVSLNVAHDKLPILQVDRIGTGFDITYKVKPVK